MALKRVTMQDIADACGLSRNTVSKVFNGRGPEATKKLVLNKAKELGYYQQPADMGGREKAARSIALLTQRKFQNHSFGAVFITSFTDALSRDGYTIEPAPNVKHPRKSQ